MNQERCKVRISLTGHGRGEVYVDGKKIPRVKALSFSSGVDKINELTLTLVPDLVELECGVCDVSSIESDYREFVRLPYRERAQS